MPESNTNSFQLSLSQTLVQAGHFFSRPRSRNTVKKILLVLFGFTFIFMTYLLSVPYLGKELSFELGGTANQDIIAYQTIRYVDKDKARIYRKDAYEKASYVFDRDYRIFFEEIYKEIDTVFDLSTVASQAQEGYLTYREAVKARDWLATYKKTDVNQLIDTKVISDLIPWARKYATEVFDSFGILKKPLPELKKFYKAGAKIRTIHATNNEGDLLFPAERIIYYKDIFGKDYRTLTSLGGKSLHNQLNEGARKIIMHQVLRMFYSNPYLSYNPEVTEHNKKQAASEWKKEEEIKRGTVIIRAGEFIDKEKFAKLNYLKEHQENFSLRYLLGMFLIQLILAIGISVFIFRFSEFRFIDLSSHVMLHSLLLIIISFAFLLSRFHVIQESEIYFALFVPVAFISSMLALLFGPRVTLALGIYISIYLFMISNYETATLLIAFISTITGIYSAEKMDKRTQFLKGAFISGIAISIVVIGSDLTQSKWDSETIYKVLLCFLNGFVSIILTVGVLPIYETLFNLPTKFRLMELADYNNMLLKKLANEAPSTYTHSLMVANLSERAVSAVGGDTLLTRVGCLYHDIGKTSNPEFYAENKHLFPNNDSFKKLGPLKSAQVIVAHVIDGIRIARENRLPEKIVAFIPEHHGTTTIQYFYHQSLQERKNSKTKKQLPKELFQYPGPKPQSKETGIIMIADSVEAASRTVKDPNRENLAELIERIINNKIDENQFSDCPLTLHDLELVKAAFLDVLISSFHGRPVYPTMKQTKTLEKNVENAKNQPRSKTTVKKKKSQKKAKKGR